MELFGTVCAVIGAGTLSAGVMKIICWLDEGAKKDRTRREAEYGQGARKGTHENIFSIHEIFHLCKGEFDVFHKIAGER